MSLTIKLLNKQTLAQQSAEIIYRNILNMKPGYEPGSRLGVKEIARELGISETPLKMALKLLESQGVLIVEARKGTYVAKLSKRDIQELMAVRFGMEGLAVQLAQGHFPDDCLVEMEECIKSCHVALEINDEEMFRENDDRFHRLIVDVSHNKRLKRLYTYLRASEQIIDVYVTRKPEARLKLIQEHTCLLEKFRSNDLSIIIVALREHGERGVLRALNGYKLADW
ncbi:MAG TPA: GntR family transcriptional regulator [Desulfosporosinus sp.]|nr:GntR family transcriptional regulator [Desulfosporosinus sp.]